MTRRRNADHGDAYIRELERRVLEGDLSLVSRLAAAYDRAGRGLDPLAVSRDMIRDAYWRDVRVVADEVAKRGEFELEQLTQALRSREHIRPHRQQQVSRLQGGWIAIPSWLAEAAAKTGRLADSVSMREAIAFSNNAAADRLVNVAAKAELCFLTSVRDEAERQLMGFPYPLGSRVRALVPFSEDDGEGEIPDRIIPVGSKGTLVDIHHHESTFTPVIITDDYWADWGDVIDAYSYDSIADFDRDFRVEGSP